MGEAGKVAVPQLEEEPLNAFTVQVPLGPEAGTVKESRTGFWPVWKSEAAVVVSPGSAYGASGEGFIRMSLTLADERLPQFPAQTHGPQPDHRMRLTAGRRASKVCAAFFHSVHKP